MPQRRPTDKQTQKAIAERIQEARLAKGWTRERLAEFLEISPEMVWRYEAARNPVSVLQLRRLSRVLSVEFAWLLGVDPPGLHKGEEELLQMWRRLEDQERIALKLLLRRVLRE